MLIHLKLQRFIFLQSVLSVFSFGLFLLEQLFFYCPWVILFNFLLRAHGVRSVPGAHGVRSVPRAHGVRSVPGAHGVRSVPGAHGVRSVPGAHGVRSVPGAHAVRSRRCSGLGTHRARSRASPTLAPLCAGVLWLATRCLCVLSTWLVVCWCHVLPCPLSVSSHLVT